uniref:Mbov_0283/Mbov_0339 family surface lipoprotein n=1 Tax=Mycoplasmopsis bovis TaxID=28903 RepID=UPI003D294195
ATPIKVKFNCGALEPTVKQADLKKSTFSEVFLIPQLRLWPIVTEFFKLHEKIVSKFDEIKKEIEEFFGKPESKNNKLDNLLKHYEKSRDEIKDALE